MVEILCPHCEGEIELDDDASHIVRANAVASVQIHRTILLHHHFNHRRQALVFALVDCGLHFLVLGLFHWQFLLQMTRRFVEASL